MIKKYPHLKLGKGRPDEPFFLQYWPVIPLSNPRVTRENYTTPNGGTYVESMKQLDGYIGDILKEMGTLGLLIV